MEGDEHDIMHLVVDYMPGRAIVHGVDHIVEAYIVTPRFHQEKLTIILIAIQIRRPPSMP